MWYLWKQVTYLVHVISADGIAINSSKVEKVWPIPIATSYWEVHQFLGLVGYYHRFIKDFATIAKPLHRLTEKTTQCGWNDHYQRAFHHLWLMYMCLYFLIIVRNSLHTRHRYKWYKNRSCTVSQLANNNRECVFAYASRTLSKPERQYCVTQREFVVL